MKAYNANCYEKLTATVEREKEVNCKRLLLNAHLQRSLHLTYLNENLSAESFFVRKSWERKSSFKTDDEFTHTERFNTNRSFFKNKNSCRSLENMS